MPVGARHPAELHHLLDRAPCTSLTEYIDSGGGRGLATARQLGSAGIIDLVSTSGLRGRGGGGFPTGRKWQTVAAAASTAAPTPVVVNGAEGEPGTFKDRTLLRRNPYRVIEGALIAAAAIGALEVVFALKASFTREIRLLTRAIDEVNAAAFATNVTMRVALGPSAYLFGEETALLEVIEHRQPLPRVTPSYRRGLDPGEQQPQRTAAHTHLASEDGTDEPPALVNNVETLANIPFILAEGPEALRRWGTPASPGTLVCTVTGRTRIHGVGEFAMGTPLRDVISHVGGGALAGRRLIAAISGVANPVIPESHFDTELTYEAMALAGSGLGAAGFIVFDDETDLVAVAGGIARFLAVESCGQCEPCKLDGVTLARHLDRLCSPEADARDLDTIVRNLDTVTNGARCYLAHQQQRTVRSILALVPDLVQAHIHHTAATATAEFIAPLVDLVGGQAILDTSQRTKQPDWTHGDADSGTSPAAKYGNTPVTLRAPAVRELRALVGPANIEAHPTGAFHRIHASHNDLRTTLTALRATTDHDERRRLLELFDTQLRRHLDATTRILYPTMLRLTSAAGDDATWTAEHDANQAVHLTEHTLRTQHEPSAANMLHLTTEVEHFIADEETLLHLLDGNLDEIHLEQLQQGLAEAFEHSTPHASPPLHPRSDPSIATAVTVGPTETSRLGHS